MPHHPLFILGWELWAKHRRTNAAVIAALPICAVGYALAVRWGGVSLRDDWLGLALLPMLASILWVFSLFSCTESDARRGFTGLPARFFSLPVRSCTLVFTLTGLGALTVAALYLAWAWFVFAPAGVAIPVWFPPAALATSIVFFQAVVWGLASFPWLRVGALVAGAFGFMVLNVAGLSDEVMWTPSERARALVVLAFLPVAVALALFGVRAERSGGWTVWMALSRFGGCVAAWLPRHTAPFPSAAAAQFWFEWRRKGWFCSIAFSFILTGVVSFIPYMALIETSPGLPVMGGLTVFLMPLLMAGTLGLGLAKSDYWSKELALQPFHALRPMSGAGLVYSKMQVAFVITVLGWLGAVPLVWLLTRLPSWREIWNVSELSPRFLHTFAIGGSMRIGLGAAALGLSMVLSWKAMVESVAIGLIGRKSALLVRCLARGLGVVLFFVLATQFFRHPGPESAVVSFLQASAGFLLLAKCAHMALACRRLELARLVPRSRIGFLILLWMAFAAALGGTGLSVWLGTGSLHPVFALWLAGLWPDGAFARALLHVQSNRHR